MSLNQRGQALVEYILIIALIVIIIFSLMQFISGYLHDVMTKATCDFSGKIYIEGKRPGDGICVNRID